MGVRVKNPPAPGTDQWRTMITASKAPAMMRDSAGSFLDWGYLTAYEQYLQMRGEWEQTFDPFLEELFAEAHDMEDFAVNHFLRKQAGQGIDWRQSHTEVAYRDPAWEIPHLATLDRVVSKGSRRAVVEVKRPVREKPVLPKNWFVQVLFQMRISGIREAYLVAVPRYGEISIHNIAYDEKIAQKILDDCTDFYQRVQDGNPPEVGASGNIDRIFGRQHPKPTEQVFDITQADFAALEAAWVELAAAETKVRTIENRLKQQMGDAGKAVYQGVPVISRRAGRFSATRVPEAMRSHLTEDAVMTPRLDAKKLRKTYPHVYDAGCGDPTYMVDRQKFLK